MEQFLYVETPSGEMLLPVRNIELITKYQKMAHIHVAAAQDGVRQASHLRELLVSHAVADIAAAINRTSERCALIRVTEKPLPNEPVPNSFRR
jgi:hypothetical protein